MIEKEDVCITPNKHTRKRSTETKKFRDKIYYIAIKDLYRLNLAPK